MNLFLDDERNPEQVFWMPIDMTEYSWRIARSFEEFTTAIGEEMPSFISFDHDLGPDKDGMDCAKWLVEFCLDNKCDCPTFQVHSKNPEGARDIHGLLSNLTKHLRGEKNATQRKS